MGAEDSHTKLYFMSRTSRAAATSCFEKQEGVVFAETKEQKTMSSLGGVTKIIFEYAQW